MYTREDTVLPSGQTAIYGLFHKDTKTKATHKYNLLAEFATMDDILRSTCIEGRLFSEIIMVDDTELLEQD